MTPHGNLIHRPVVDPISPGMGSQNRHMGVQASLFMMKLPVQPIKIKWSLAQLKQPERLKGTLQIRVLWIELRNGTNRLEGWHWFTITVAINSKWLRASPYNWVLEKKSNWSEKPKLEEKETEPSYPIPTQYLYSYTWNLAPMSLKLI